MGSVHGDISQTTQLFQTVIAVRFPGSVKRISPVRSKRIDVCSLADSFV